MRTHPVGCQVSKVCKYIIHQLLFSNQYTFSFEQKCIELFAIMESGALENRVVVIDFELFVLRFVATRFIAVFHET